MAFFRKKPVVVEAVQFRVSDVEDLPVQEWPNGIFLDSFGVAYVVTIHGQKTRIIDGDWVITEPDGIHHYPCKPDIFAATYEPAEESNAAHS